jgi:3-oxoacyl-[acyl-carrier-protein] synthase II
MSAPARTPTARRPGGPALRVAGWAALSPAGSGAAALYGGLSRSATGALPDFDVRQLLGRKGTSAFDRATAMAVVACGQALADSGLTVDDANRRRVGVALGTTMGSLQSTADYSKETLIQDRPYLVNPMLFPNTVMNRAAGQAAIWYGLKGVNATVAGGPLASFHALRYAHNALRRGYADVMLAGGVEELTEYRSAAHQRSGATVPAGEAAAVLVLRRAGEPTDPDSAAGEAEILATVCGFAPPQALADGLAGCVARCLAQAGVAAEQVAVVVTGVAGDDAVVRRALAGLGAPRLHLAEAFGDCQAAAGALQAATALARHRAGGIPDGAVSLLVGYGPRGAVAASVMRGYGRAGAVGG